MSSDDDDSETGKYSAKAKRHQKRTRHKPTRPFNPATVKNAGDDDDLDDLSDDDDVISPLIRPFAVFLNQSNKKSPVMPSDLLPKSKSKLKRAERSSASSTPPTGDSAADLVLIKYKQSLEESSYNSLRASQLQKKREVQSLLLFIFFLFITIITLSQILVMHSHTNNSNFHQVKLMQEELKLMDASIDKMLKEKHVLPIQVWFALKQYNDNLRKFSRYMSEFIYTNNGTAVSIYNQSKPGRDSKTGDYSYQAAAALLFDTSSRRVVDSSESAAVSLNTISDDLMSQLKNCTRTELTYTFLDVNKEGNAQQRLALEQTYAKTSRWIYTKMLEYLRKLKKNAVRRKQRNATAMSDDDFLNFTAYEPVLNDYLNTTARLMSELSEASGRAQRRCVQSLFYSLYYYFNAKFSILFEQHLSQVSAVHNGTGAFDNELIDETVSAIRANYFLFNRNVPLNGTDGAHLLKMPIRNVNDYVRRYKQSKNKFNPNKSLCDPIPPVLCKNFCFLFLFSIFNPSDCAKSKTYTPQKKIENEFTPNNLTVSHTS
jgi:hypothetical protein